MKSDRWRQIPSPCPPASGADGPRWAGMLESGRVGNPPRPYAHTHHRHATSSLAGDHLGSGSSAPLPALRIFRSLLTPLPSLLTAAKSGEYVEKPKSGALRLDEPLIDCYNLLGYAEVAEWQTRRSQKPLGINPRVGSSPTFGTTTNDSGAWLSLVERRVRVAEVGGSNPLAPTKPKERLCIYTDALCYRQNLFKRRYGDLLMMILSNGDTHRTGRGGCPICPHQFTNGT